MKQSVTDRARFSLGGSQKTLRLRAFYRIFREARELLSTPSVRESAIVLGVSCWVFLGGPALADILVLRSSQGQLFLTNRGERPGYRVVARYREFAGSSGLGLRSLRVGDSSRFDDLVRQASARFEVDPALVKAVIRAESAFDPGATSPKGAMGLMQLMPETARLYGVRNAYDPIQNVHGGVRHLRNLIERYEGALDLVLAAYNAGTKPVDEAGGIPPYPETREYVRRVRLFHAHYRASLADEPNPSRRPSMTRRLAALELDGKDPEELYGRPIVLVGD